MNSVNFGGMSDYESEAQQLADRRKYAEALRAQGQQAPQGRMAGRVYVAPNPLEYLANALRQYSGQRELQDVRTEEKGLATRRRDALQETMRDFSGALQGSPAQTAPSMAFAPNPDGSPRMVETSPAVAPDRAKALAVLLKNPDTAQAALAAQLAQLGKTAQWKVTERFNEKTGKEEKVLFNEINPAEIMPFGGQKATKMEVGPAGQVYDPYGIKAGEVLQDPNKPFAVPGGKVVANPSFQRYEIDKAAAGAARNNNTVINAGPKAFETELGKLDAEKLGQFRTAAEAGQSTLQTVASLRSAEKSGVFDGGGASAKTALANMVYGITGVEMKELPGSQMFNAQASKLILDQVKTLGANPSNADREFIEKTVPNLSTSATARAQLLDFMEKKAKGNIDLYKRADSHARKNSGLNGFNYLDADQDFSGWSIEERK